MVWSIPDEQDRQDAREFANRIRQQAVAENRPVTENEEETMRQRRANVRLDFNAYGIPEGIHPCYHRAGSAPQDFGKSVGVLVRDGQFVIPTTHAAIFEAVCLSYCTTANAVRTGQDFIDHIFIEELTWDHDRKAVRIGTGS